MHSVVNELTNNFYVICSFSLLLFVFTPSSQVVTGQPTSFNILSGYVVESETGRRLVGAHLYLPSLQRGTTTNEHGFYRLALPSDSTKIVVSYLGHETKSRTLTLSSDRRHTFRLPRTTVEAGSLEVVREATLLGTPTSTVELESHRAERTPVLLGETDIRKTLLLFPGVSSGAEGMSRLHVRGGTPDQNLILLDGVVLYNASHLFGFLSSFNPDIVENVRLTKGGIPARYGGRLSSVVEVTTEAGNWKSYDVEGSLGLISSRLSLQGPIRQEGTSFLLSGRRTYFDVLARTFRENLNRGYYFYDGHGKINHRFSSRDLVSIGLYKGNDRMYSQEGAGSNEVRSDLGWDNLYSTLDWNHAFGGRLFSTATLTYSRYRLDLNVRGRQGDAHRLRYRSTIRDGRAQIDFDYSPNPQHDLRMGAELTRRISRPEATYVRRDAPSGGVQDTTLAKSQKVRTFETSIYIEDDLRWTGQFRTNIGVRTSSFFVHGSSYVSVQPRLSARYRLKDRWALKGSYSRMYQPIHLLTNSSLGFPSDLWVSSTKRIEPERAHQVTLGLDGSPGKGEYVGSVDVYGKLMQNVLEYREGAAFTVTPDTDWQDRVVSGRGWSYGAEILLRRTRGRVAGWLSYTLSWTRRQFDALNDGKPFPFRYDRRHDFSTTLSYRASDITHLSATWVYASGEAATLPEAQYRIPRSRQSPGPVFYETVQTYGERNADRLRPYHRLDVGVDFRWGKKENVHALKVGVYNVYNRKNTYFLEVDSKLDGTLEANRFTLFPILPYISYRFKL